MRQDSSPRVCLLLLGDTRRTGVFDSSVSTHSIQEDLVLRKHVSDRLYALTWRNRLIAGFFVVFTIAQIILGAFFMALTGDKCKALEPICRALRKLMASFPSSNSTRSSKDEPPAIPHVPLCSKYEARTYLHDLHAVAAGVRWLRLHGNHGLGLPVSAACFCEASHLHGSCWDGHEGRHNLLWADFHITNCCDRVLLPSLSMSCHDLVWDMSPSYISCVCSLMAARGVGIGGRSVSLCCTFTRGWFIHETDEPTSGETACTCHRTYIDNEIRECVYVCYPRLTPSYSTGSFL